MSLTWEDVGIKPITGRQRYYTTCPKCDHTREKHKGARCLTVNDEPGNRWWKCHHCTWSGNLDVEDKYDKVRENSKMPDRPATAYTKQVREYLNGRGFSTKTVLAAKVYETVDGRKNTLICFPFYMNQTLVNVKFFNMAWKPGYKGPKWFQLKKELNTRPIPLGMQLLKYEGDAPRVLIITEGEWDWLTWKECGYNNVVSVPMGAPSEKAKDFSKEFAYMQDPYVKSVLADIQLFYLCVDNDAPGKLLRDQLATILGKSKCRIVRYPVGYKDINEVYVGHEKKKLPSLQQEGVDQCFQTAGSFPIQGVIRVSDVRDDMRKHREDGFTPGLGIGIPEVDRLYTLKRKHIRFLTGVPGSGKALAIDTLIPTPEGFKYMGDLRVGDKVYDENGKECSVIRTTKNMFDRPCYKMIFSDGNEVVCDEDHLWLTNTRKSRLSEIRAKKNGRDKPRPLKLRGNDQTSKREFPSVKTTKEISQSVTTASDNRLNHGIAIAGHIEGEEKQLLIDPYVLGAWLGDGSSYHNLFTTADPEIITHIRKAGYKVNKIKTKYGWGIQKIVWKLKKLGLYMNKHIPVEYMTASYTQRLELLRGLMDTDGYFSYKKQEAEFTNMNQRLAKDAYALICSLGMQARIKTQVAKLYGRSVGVKYRIFYKPTRSVFNLTRKAELQKFNYNPRDYVRFIKSCEKVESVPVKCIEVNSPSKLFLCTEAFIPTHNSVYERWYIVEQIKHNIDLDLKWAMFTPENRPVSREYARIAEVFTGRAIKKEMPNSMNDIQFQKAMRFIEKHFFIISPDRKNFESFNGKIDSNAVNTLNSVMQYVRYLKETENIFGFVIDAWNKIEHQQPRHMTETSFISQQLDALIDFCDYYDVHGSIVVHPKKIESSGQNYKMPSMYDIKGSSAWKEKADIGLIAHRYKYRKRTADEMLDFPNADDDDLWAPVYDAPTIIRTEKIRFEELGIEDRVKLMMDPKRGGRFFVEGKEKEQPKQKTIEQAQVEKLFEDMESDDPEDLPF